MAPNREPYNLWRFLIVLSNRGQIIPAIALVLSFGFGGLCVYKMPEKDVHLFGIDFIDTFHSHWMCYAGWVLLAITLVAWRSMSQKTHRLHQEEMTRIANEIPEE